MYVCVHINARMSECSSIEVLKANVKLLPARQYI